MRRGGLLLAALLALAPALPARSDTAIRGPVAALQAADLRVAGVAWRLISGNAARCPRQMPGTGLLLHALVQYSGPSRQEALALAPFPSPVSVLAVVPGSPAARAGLRSGDGLEAINGVPLASLPTSGPHASARRDAAELALAASPLDTVLTLTVRRAGGTEEIALSPVTACRTRIEVVAGATVRARSDGGIIQIGEQFAASLDDEGLATVLAHELAHTVLDHRSRRAAIEAGGSARQRKALARQFEDEADLLGLDLLAGGGWDPAIAPRFMRREAKRLDRYSGGGVHRKARDRAARMEQALTARPANAG